MDKKPQITVSRTTHCGNRRINSNIFDRRCVPGRIGELGVRGFGPSRYFLSRNVCQDKAKSPHLPTQLSQSWGFMLRTWIDRTQCIIRIISYQAIPWYCCIACTDHCADWPYSSFLCKDSPCQEHPGAEFPGCPRIWASLTPLKRELDPRLGQRRSRRRWPRRSFFLVSKPATSLSLAGGAPEAMCEAGGTLRGAPRVARRAREGTSGARKDS